MKSKLVQKYLAKSPVASKGRMNQPRIGTRSTRPRDRDMITYHIRTKANPQPYVEPEDTVPEDFNLIPEDSADVVNIIFCFAAFAYKQTGTIHRCHKSTASNIVRRSPTFLCGI